MSKKSTAYVLAAIKLDDIRVDYGWHSRYVSNLEDMDNYSDGFRGLVADIANSGQISPVIVRPTHGRTLRGGKTDREYELIVGFRRVRAITYLNTAKDEINSGIRMGLPRVPNVPDGYILAEIRELDDVQARILNGAENTQQKILRVPDFVCLVRDLLDCGLVQHAVSRALGMTQGEVDWLGEIATLPRPILDHWRSRTPIAPVVLDTGTFEIAPEDETRELHHTTMRSFAVFNTGKRPEEIIAHYVQIVKIGGETRQGPGTGEEPRDRIDRANQIRARAELRSNCRKYLQVAEPDRTPQAVEQILLAMLEYLDGEEMASAANHDATMCEDAARAATKA